MTKESRFQTEDLKKKRLFHEEYGSEIARFCKVVRRNLDMDQKITKECESGFTRWLNCEIMAIIPILSDRDRAESWNKVCSLSECCCL
jgi:hypothetical protein